MPCYSLDGLTPVVHPGAFVHSAAVLMGDVIVDVRCSAPFAQPAGRRSPGI